MTNMITKSIILIVTLSICVVLPNKLLAQSKTTLGSSIRESWVLYTWAHESVIWSVPAIQSMQIKKELFEKSGKKNSLAYISGDATAKMVMPTFNNVSAPVFGNLDLKDGPMVIEFPAASEKGKYFGSILDVWDSPIADFGPAGIDKGMGGKFLLIPPGYEGNVSSGYTEISCPTFNVHFFLRSIPMSKGKKGYQDAVKYALTLKAYPLAEANKAATNWFDLSTVEGYFWACPLPREHDIFELIDAFVQEEVVFREDLVMYGILKYLGIEKGKSFNPDDYTREILNGAAKDAFVNMERYLSSGKAFEQYWEGTSWGAFRFTPEILKTGGTYKFDNYLDYHARAKDYSYFAAALPKHFNNEGGGATFYVMTSTDKDGNPINGKNNYKLTVPANVPVKDFWSLLMYSTKYRSYTDSERFGLSSQDDLQINTDGSVDIYIGLEPPAGKKSNWLGTVKNDGIFFIFRFYGPEKIILDKTWRLPDFEMIKKSKRNKKNSNK
jgi:hypothetical protein